MKTNCSMCCKEIDDGEVQRCDECGEDGLCEDCMGNHICDSEEPQ